MNCTEVQSKGTMKKSLFSKIVYKKKSNPNPPPPALVRGTRSPHQPVTRVFYTLAARCLL